VLRASRANYQSVVLQQQAVRNNLLGSLGEVLQPAETDLPSRRDGREQGYCQATA